MICSNIDCKKEFIPKQSNASYCTKKCSMYTYYLKNKEKLKPYRKEFSKNYRINNKEKCKTYQREYRLKNKELVKKKAKIYYLNNIEKYKANKKQYYLQNLHIHNALSAKRRAVKLKATPRFANLEKIKDIYKNCPKGFHVDHIVPLQGKNVCGLHVEWNLQYLTPYDNKSKSNKLIV